MKIAFVQWPDGLEPAGTAWDSIRRTVDAAGADLLVTNEMPFGEWFSRSAAFDAERAKRSVDLHERALDALSRLQVSAVISSRPVAAQGRLANEAFVLESTRYRAIHHKQYFPHETGFFEDVWFHGDQPGFDCVEIGAARVGVLLCTELFFNEHARRYGRMNADLIVAPRSTGTSTHRWQIAGAMAAIVSGAYLVTSNRQGRTAQGQEFGGMGFAMSPDGVLVAQTTEAATLETITIDLSETRMRKSKYPCYVKELERQ
jgi:N-carbamoylputrescine amidase